MAETTVAISHYRQSQGRREADLILEGPAGRIVAVEIKASATPTRQMARHLLSLSNDLGDRMLGGVLFHTGQHALRIDDRIWALPISCIWS